MSCPWMFASIWIDFMVPFKSAVLIRLSGVQVMELSLNTVLFGFCRFQLRDC